ncbi:MAG TPA: diguanylate cyclase [Longimicrobium sp.]|nr:diguanylate cyclase [Longimicrobium sp.]
MANSDLSSPAAPAGDLRQHIRALNARAWAERYANPRQAVELAREAANLAAAHDYVPGLATSLCTRGVCLILLSEYDEAASVLRAAYDLCRGIGDRSGEATALRWLGHDRARAGDHGDALRLHAEALTILREIGDRAGEADTLLAIGRDHQQIGEYAEALHYGLAALAIKEELEDTLGVGNCLNNLGIIHSLLGEHDQALNHYTRSLELLRQAGAAHVGSALNNIGSTYRSLGLLESALEYFSRAHNELRNAGDRRAEVSALCNVAEVTHLLGQHAEALELFETALAASRELGARYEEAAILLHAGEALAAQGEHARAVRHLEEAVHVGSEAGARHLVVQANRDLARLHEEAGNLAEAFRRYKAYRELESEIFGQEADQKIRAVMVKAEVEKAQHEAELLRHRADELERQTREDALTGLYNRRYLDAVLATELERAHALGHDLALAIADVDWFKEVNDRFSHGVGDRVLRQVGSLLREGVRAIDAVARYGGEEFVVLLVETPLEHAAAVCESLRAAVERYDWDAIHPGLRVTLSIGLASVRDAASPASLLAAADARLYEAKRSGRNRVCH